MSLWGAVGTDGGRTILRIVEVVTIVVALPIACELAFRGYLLRRLTSRSFVTVDPRKTGWIALLISACAFAAVSGSFSTMWPAGLLYGIAYRRRGCLGDAIVAHGVANLLSVALTVLMAIPPR